MKAKIKATGEIVHVGDYNTISHDPRYKDERTGPWRLEELDFNDTADYWDKLLHQYAGMAMQGLLNNSLLSSVLFKTGTTHEAYVNEVVKVAKEYAHALVEKMKEDNMYETKR